jgi:LDH2 family malate/lactate/ureidoglycolate dehydrogenase
MIPNDVAYNSKGHPTTDPMEAMKGALRGFDRSYKGSHLALMVELLAGALTGASMTDKNNSNNWGTLIIAIDPAVLGKKKEEFPVFLYPNPNLLISIFCISFFILGPIEDFQERAAVMCDRVKNAKRLPGHEDKKMFLPGERGDLLEAENIANGYIKMSNKLHSDLTKMALFVKESEK